MNYFLFDPEKKLDVPLNDSSKISLEKAIEEFYHLCDDNGSFFGLQNQNGAVLQFSWEDEDEWLVDMPSTNGMSFQRH